MLLRTANSRQIMLKSLRALEITGRRRHASHTLGKVADMFVVAGWAESLEGFVKLQQILSILATGSHTLVDSGRYFLLAEGSQELGIIRHSDIYQAMKVRTRWVGRMEGGVLDTISVDLTYVEVVAYLFHSLFRDVVSHSPDFVFI
jgi:hypothetical protein